MAEATHESQVTRAFSRLNETTYGTDRANSDDFRQIVSSTHSIANVKAQFADDAGYDNGSDLANDKWATTVDVDAPFTPDFNFQDAGYFLKDALGGYAASGSGPYIHTFTPQSMNTSRQLPSRTLLEKIGGLYLQKISSIANTQLIIRGSKMGRLGIAAQYTGSGRDERDPSGYAMPALAADREFAYGSQVAYLRVYDNDDGTNQVETATAAGTASGDGELNVTITAVGMAGSPVTVVVGIATGDTPSVWANKVRVALRNHKVISGFFEVSGATTAIILTSRLRAANDTTLNIAITAGGTGITPITTSVNTTAGTAGDNQDYLCAIEDWAITIDNSPADPGYRACSSYVIDDEPRSGQYRSEFYVGQRKYTFTFGARLGSGDKIRDWMRRGTDVSIEIPIIGKDSGNSSLRLTHTRGIIEAADTNPNLNNFVGHNVGIDLMSNNGSIPFTAVLQNDVISYAT